MSESFDPAAELAILRAALAVSRQIDLQPAAAAFVRAAGEVAGGAQALLYLFDGEADVFRLAAATLEQSDARREGIGTLDFAGLRAMGATTPILAAPPAALRVFGPGPILAAPLLEAERVFGFLILADPRGPFDTAELDRAGRLVAEMLPGLQNARQVEAFRELVIKDDQTECFNRRHFDRCLSEEIYRAQRYAQALALVFLDLDNLKEVNARYGHAVGSRTVREVARRLVVGIRGSDRAFRYGGDEFCLVLPATDLQGAIDLCERLRHAIASQPFVADSTTHVAVTASFGIAAYPDHARTSLGLIKCADEAMQRAKKEGKDAVRVAPAALPEGGARAAGGVR
ncbi:MAG TPA: GGDEF domain-containing protein [Candidatus Polarisedimenticolia bacterium]|nr:GGDEF domain-containing protein [Candidatus Polarisedimenticolia bacterium]